jgi:hypothetical protein
MIEVISFKLAVWIMISSIHFDTFIPVSVTLITCQGHSSVRQVFIQSTSNIVGLMLHVSIGMFLKIML